MLRLLLINGGVLALGVILLELIFGTWFDPQRGALYEFLKPKNVALRFDIDFPQYQSEVVYTRDAFGLRGVDGPLEDVALVVVGGSTTDQRYVTDDATWDAVLEQRFREHGRNIDTVNAGIDGQTLYGHLRNFDYWFPRIPNFKPAYYLYYVGINDFYNLGPRPGFDDIEATSWRRRIEGRIRDSSALFAGYRILRSVLDVSATPGHHQIEFERFPYSEREPLVNAYDVPEVALSLDRLRENMRALIDATRSAGATPIVVTQRSVKWRRAEDGTVEGVGGDAPPRYADALAAYDLLNGVDVYRLEDLQRRTLMEECEAGGAICIDLGSELALQPGVDTYDWAHTTDLGSRKVGEYLFNELVGNI